MAAITIIGLTVLALFATTALADCPDGWTQYGGECYNLYRLRFPWLEASNICHEFGAHLASMETEQATKNVVEYFKSIKNDGDVWVGGRSMGFANSWTWMNNMASFSYTNWAQGQPDGGDQNCLLLLDNGGEYKWHDDRCENRREFLCAKSSTVCTCPTPSS